MSEKKLTLPLLDPQLLRPALWEAGKKLSLRAQLRNPVMAVVYLGSLLCSALWVQALLGQLARKALRVKQALQVKLAQQVTWGQVV